MKFFAIEYSRNKKLVGKIPQVKEYIHHCDVDNDPAPQSVRLKNKFIV
jgi:hypothetical protein